MSVGVIEKESLNDIRFNPKERDVVINNNDFSTVSSDDLYNQNGFLMLGTNVVNLLDPTLGINLNKYLATADKEAPLRIWRNMMNIDNASSAIIYFKDDSNEINISVSYTEKKPFLKNISPESVVYLKTETTYTVLGGETILDVAINATGVPSVENMREIIKANNLESLTPVLVPGSFLIIPTSCSMNTNVINQMKNNFKNYPVIDFNFIGLENLNVLQEEFLTILNNL